MSNFAIICDVTCDLSKELQAKYNIRALDGHYKTPDGVEHTANCEWGSEEAAIAFYNDLKKNPAGYTTAPLSPDEVKAVLEEYIAQGTTDILCLTISTGLSGTYNFFNAAKEEVLAAHPEANIKVVNSLRYSTAFGAIAIKASLLREEGKSFDEVYAWVEENKNSFHQMGWLDDLSFLAKKGRMNNFKAFMGQLIGIKPLGEINHNGLTTVIGKAKGASKAYEAMLAYMEKTIVDPNNQIIFIAQTNRKKFAEEFRTLVEERFHPAEIIMTDVHVMNGINIGPGLMAAYYFGKPTSENLVEETAIMDSILGTK